ncbi:uncharacterized protein LOC135101759 isoform X2 [Scylla paramamosain]|uniref:uncharacterized protein LOC135101759 isoform X2 n=1 Tax=Scylla paramamosain TaxID=85552 RepID=UPI0030827180
MRVNSHHYSHTHRHHHDSGVEGGSCRKRGSCGPAWCSRETWQAAVQLVLLCLASCSWTLLLISLTLTSPISAHRHVVEAVVDPGPPWKGGSAEACEECLTRHGPPGTYWRVFQGPLQQVVAALNRLDQPLAPPALRAHLLGTRTLLQHLASVLHLPLFDHAEDDTETKRSEAAVWAAPGEPHGKLACQERFLGSKVGYPRYVQGFTRVACTALPLKQVVTAVLWDVDPKYLKNLLSNFERIYPELPLLLLSDADAHGGDNLVVEPPTPSVPQALAKALARVKTPYVLLASNLTQLSHHSRLERLVWVAEWAGVWAVGGSVRGADGRWRAGCLQVREDHGQLVYARGYDASMHECQLCQAIDGPVVMRTAALASLNWPENATARQLLFPELFLEIHAKAAPHQHGAAVCPDAMFLQAALEAPWQVAADTRLQGRELQRVAALWRPLARQRHLVRLHLPSGVIINYPCDFRPAVHDQTSGLPWTLTDAASLPPWTCERQEITAILSQLLQTCDILHIKCFLPQASLPGADGDSSLPGSEEGEDGELQVRAAVAFLPPRLSLLANFSHYTTSHEGESLKVTGRWWRVILTPTPVPYSLRWIRREVVDGVWAWIIQPDIEKRHEGTGGPLPNLRAADTTWEEDVQVLMRPRCAAGSHLPACHHLTVTKDSGRSHSIRGPSQPVTVSLILTLARPHQPSALLSLRFLLG